MKCTNKVITMLITITAALFLLAGCQDKNFTNEYDINSSDYAYNIINSSENLTVKPFASNICVVADNETADQ
ncbi:hypothetical protein CG709_19435 [Lachnotalea glycerini]|nr:hypothetical protein CG709_19435 [Lachnotalea glycerini]